MIIEGRREGIQPRISGKAVTATPTPSRSPDSPFASFCLHTAGLPGIHSPCAECKVQDPNCECRERFTALQIRLAAVSWTLAQAFRLRLQMVP